MKKFIGMWCCVCLFPIVQTEAATPQGVRIYEPAFTWDAPELVVAPCESLLFTEPDTGPNCSRSFYYTGVSSSGCVYVINVFHWRTSWFDGWGMAIVASDAEGHTFVYEGRIDDQDVIETKGTLSIRFGDNLLESEGPVSRIRLQVGEFRCDLSLRSILPPWIPGDGYAVLIGDRDIYMRKSVPVPLAETSGFLSIGTTVIPADGWSYGDRSLTVAPPGQLNCTGCAVRVFSRHGTDDAQPWILALLDYTSVGRQEGLRIPMLLVAHGSEWILTSKGYCISYEDPVRDAATSFSYPGRIHLSAASRGYSLEGDFLPDRLIHTSDIIENLPGLFRGIAALFLKRPIMFRMAGQFVGTLVAPDGSVESLLLAGQGDYFTVR